MHHSKMSQIPLGIYEGHGGKRLNYLGVGKSEHHASFRIFLVTDKHGNFSFLIRPVTSGMWDERHKTLHLDREIYRLIDQYEKPYIP